MDKLKNDRKYYFFALKIAGDFGVSIAAPVVIFVLIGQYFDNKYNLTPYLTILAFVIAALISGKIIHQKAKKYGEEYQKLR
ncbi:MAG: hypothetical protein UV20_C0009G0082 [Candidatus Magasanikbacteria bacterium GW2011_GWA2_42_32]|uniref:AtpZ/AtpI family protein n=1 Tax=Candidatus Magasanikbacteria bacterium GW2011_GWA2_42_32 TaxID=1619039 RepID=A0A0G1D3Q1_9BACT|nr:MAG: hypothetical protein UV20_C0009G0082 [Candidatus Magasanikbacteria bacterium GW2011_GWA2_42_32]